LLNIAGSRAHKDSVEWGSLSEVPSGVDLLSSSADIHSRQTHTGWSSIVVVLVLQEVANQVPDKVLPKQHEIVLLPRANVGIVELDQID
jgi:hypothetical protein